ncbi:hypothetical protein PR048_012188 [Dryococelus australis]|uniref:DUF4817 domain-containing protein n=1 Tax=Dryococelus australis TaxID=614101 RepID=A0ABQ9HP15_9NEOP|nr:hypothetical protein PR048_012188 [Dryococelus australis]
MADIIFCYGLANGSNRRARVLYAEKYPARRVSSARLFSRLFQRLADTGYVASTTADRSRPRTICTPDMEKRVLQRV